jgi:hypothetical protein
MRILFLHHLTQTVISTQHNTAILVTTAQMPCRMECFFSTRFKYCNSTFYFFAPYIVIQLRNVNQQKIICSNSILPVIYTFRTSCVPHLEDHLYMQFFMVCFPCIYESTSLHLLDCLHKRTKSILYKTHVQMVFLMMNTWYSKHTEDRKNWIKALI